MDEKEKTLLQQIREREQEYAHQLETVRQETEAAIVSAKAEAENLLCTADGAVKKEAEELYWQEKAKMEAVAEDLRREAAAEREAAGARAEQNLSRAARTVAGYVTRD